MFSIFAKGPSLYHVSKRTGWVGSEMAIFADVQYCIYADIVGGCVKKSPKICWRDIGMVPKLIMIWICRQVHKKLSIISGCTD